MQRHAEHDWHLEALDNSIVRVPQSLTSADLQHLALKRLKAAQAANLAHRAKVRLWSLSTLLVLAISLAAIAGI